MTWGPPYDFTPAPPFARSITDHSVERKWDCTGCEIQWPNHA